MLSQLQFPGMPVASPTRAVGEKSRPASPPPEPDGETLKGEGTETWTPHSQTGSGIRTVGRGGYNPDDLATIGSAPVRREVPIQSADGPQVWSLQDEGVSMDRVHQIERAPHTANPGNEAPEVTVNPHNEITIYDGNHRMTAALRQNQMFQPVNDWVG
jgi:hypothetical protein